MNRQKTTVPGLALALVLGSVASGALGAEPGWEAVDKVFGTTGKSLAGGVYRFGWPRTDLRVSVGSVAVEPALALGAWGAFLRTGAGDEVMTMGDLVLLDSEVTPVVTALEAGGLEVTAIHNHLLNETPHVAYVHFSGRGDGAALAKGLKSALEKTKTPAAAPKSGTPTPGEEATLKKLQEALGRTGSMAGRVLQVGVPRAEAITENGMEVPPTMGMANFVELPGRRRARRDDGRLRPPRKRSQPGGPRAPRARIRRHRSPLAHAGGIAPPLLHALLGRRWPGEDRGGAQGRARKDSNQVGRTRSYK